MIKIELFDAENNVKKYTVPFTNTRTFRTFLEMQTRGVLNMATAEDMDEVVSFICDVFRNQFTIDEFYDGVPAHQFADVIQSVVTAIAGEDKSNHPANEGK